MLSANDTVIGMQDLRTLTSAIADGAAMDEALQLIFDSFGGTIPFHRIGFARIDNELQRATAMWAKSDQRILLRGGYSASLQMSSLGLVLAQRKPRILNDLPGYLERRPTSRSTELIVKEGFRSSLTVPVFVGDDPYGFLFFSNRSTDAFRAEHVTICRQISLLLSTVKHIDSDAPVTTRPAHSVQPPSLRRHGAPHANYQTRQTSSSSNSIRVSISHLRPGMELVDSIELNDGTLLLAEGTMLASPAIDKLIQLRNQDLLAHQTYRVAR